MTMRTVEKVSARIVRNERTASDACLLECESEVIASMIEPGQFVNILPSAETHETPSSYRIIGEEEWSRRQAALPRQKGALLRRPFSLHAVGYSKSGQKNTFSVLFRIKGKGTRIISELKPGDMVNVLGPLGNPLPLPKNGGTTVFVIAGGYGVAPMLPFAEKASAAGHQVTFFCGFETRESIPLSTKKVSNRRLSQWSLSRLEEQGIESYCAIRQHVSGAYIGTVLELFSEYVAEQYPVEERNTVLYTCGPEGMMKALCQFSADKGWPCRVSLEKYMACGIGACMSCICKMKSKRENQNYQYLRTCTDGPSFWGDQVLWD